MPLPTWLATLRRQHVIEVVKRDPRTSGDHLLGVHRDRIFRDVIGGGQADFTRAWIDTSESGVSLSPADIALLYAWFNMKGHLLELVTAFEMLCRHHTRLTNPVVLDLGCGPGTGCLAIAHALGPTTPFDYIGIDRASSMLNLGHSLTSAAEHSGNLVNCQRRWMNSFDDVEWPGAPGWRPTIVIVSYLLASSTLDPVLMVEKVETLAGKIGRGPVLILYTNSIRNDANMKFPSFQSALRDHGFELLFDNSDGRIPDGTRTRSLRYAMFVRQAQRVLTLGGA